MQLDRKSFYLVDITKDNVLYIFYIFFYIMYILCIFAFYDFS